MTIAIDGYSSSGKSTFAKAIAKRLNYVYIDSGAMYRALTLLCIRKNIIDNAKIDEEKLDLVLKNIKIKFIYNNRQNRYETHMNRENVEDEIRSINVSEHVSFISKIKRAREKMVEIQRKLGQTGNIVMDGRDIGTVVFPEADIKIFLTADVDIRAKRRYKELLEKGLKVNFEEIKKNIVERDFIDETREESPLRKADDAIVLDNSNMTPDEQLEWFMKLDKIDKGNDS
jgi:cytidylate kinase